MVFTESFKDTVSNMLQSINIDVLNAQSTIEYDKHWYQTDIEDFRGHLEAIKDNIDAVIGKVEQEYYKE